MSKQRLIATGEIEKGNALFRLDCTPHAVHGRKRLEFFTYLQIGVYEEALCVPIPSTFLRYNDTSPARQLVRRLKDDFCDRSIIKNERRAYRLILEPEEILICPAFWKLPANIIDPKLLNLLRVAHDNFWRRLSPTPSVTALSFPSFPPFLPLDGKKLA